MFNKEYRVKARIKLETQHKQLLIEIDAIILERDLAVRQITRARRETSKRG